MIVLLGHYLIAHFMLITSTNHCATINFKTRTLGGKYLCSEISGITAGFESKKWKGNAHTGTTISTSLFPGLSFGLR